MGAGVALLSMSCGQQGQGRVPRRLADPVRPSVEADWGTLMGPTVNAGDEQNTGAATERTANELALLYVNSGRDFHEAKGLDGFVLQVTPLNQKYETVRNKAEVTILLYPVGSTEATEKPLRVWQIPGGELEKYWSRTKLLDGFVFRLGWGERPLPRGDYKFVVCFNYQQAKAKQVLCREINFQDYRGR